MKMFFVIVATLGLTACATSPSLTQMSAAQIAAKTQITKTPYESEATVTGMTINGDMPGSGFVSPGWLLWHLRSWVDADGKSPRTQIILDLSYTAVQWRYYESVNLRGGRSIKTTTIRRNVDDCGQLSGCSFDEIIAFQIPTDLLRQRADQGFSFQVNPQIGDAIVVSVPTNYLHGFLMALDSHKHSSQTQ